MLYDVRVTFRVEDDPGSEESIAEQTVNALCGMLDAKSVTVTSVDEVHGPPPPVPRDRDAQIIEFPTR